MDKEYLQSLYTPEQQLLLFGDANYFDNQNTNNLPFTSMADMAAKNANLDLFPAPQDFYTSPTYLMKQAQKFNQNPFRTGITSSSAAIPFGTQEDIEQGFVEGSPSDTSFAPTLGIDTSFGVANEPDEEEETKSGIMKLIEFLTPGRMLSNFLPKQSPEITSMKNFYRRNYGLTPTGQVASGIMQGYNPVYGGFLNMISGGKFGQPTQFGLAKAARERIDKIANRKAPQTDASRAKIEELQRFARADEISRARQANPDVYRAAERQGFIDSRTGGFKSAGTNEAFSNKTGRGRTGY